MALEQKYRPSANLHPADKLELGVEDAQGNPISALTILSLLERVAGIIDNVQSGQQRMEERQLELESSIKAIQGDVVKLGKDHGATGATVEKLLQKTRKVSSNVKEVRARVDKQNLRVKKVETAQEELLTRNKFRVVIFQGDHEIPSVAVTKTPKGGLPPGGLEGLEIDPDDYDIPADLSSDEEYTAADEADASRAGRLKKSGMRGIENIKAAFSKESMSKTKDNIGVKFHNLGDKVVTPERREKMHQAGERLKQSSERLKENIAKKAPTKETFRIKLKKERTVEEEAVTTVTPTVERKTSSPLVTYTEVVVAPAETKREGPVEEAVAKKGGGGGGEEEEAVLVVPGGEAEEEEEALVEVKFKEVEDHYGPK